MGFIIHQASSTSYTQSHLNLEVMGQCWDIRTDVLSAVLALPSPAPSPYLQYHLHKMQNTNRSKRFPIDIYLSSKKKLLYSLKLYCTLGYQFCFPAPTFASFLNLSRKYCREKCVHPAAAQIPREQPFLGIKTAFLIRKNSHGEMWLLQNISKRVLSLEKYTPCADPGPRSSPM